MNHNYGESCANESYFYLFIYFDSEETETTTERNRVVEPIVRSEKVANKNEKKKQRSRNCLQIVSCSHFIQNVIFNWLNIFAGFYRDAFINIQNLLCTAFSHAGPLNRSNLEKNQSH